MEETYLDQRGDRRLQQSIVECSEQDEAQITSWAFAASDSISSRLDLVLPLGTVGPDKRVRYGGEPRR